MRIPPGSPPPPPPNDHFFFCCIGSFSSTGQSCSAPAAVVSIKRPKVVFIKGLIRHELSFRSQPAHAAVFASVASDLSTALASPPFDAARDVRELGPPRSRSRRSRVGNTHRHETQTAICMRDQTQTATIQRNQSMTAHTNVLLAMTHIQTPRCLTRSE